MVEIIEAAIAKNKAKMKEQKDSGKWSDDSGFKDGCIELTNYLIYRGIVIELEELLEVAKEKK